MAVFPTLPGLAWTVGKTPIFSTGVHTSRTGRETRLAYYSYPRWQFRLAYQFLRDRETTPANQTPADPYDELRELLGFFLARRGRYESFFFTDPSANTIADASRQTVAVANGATTDFVVPVAYGGFVDLIGGVNTMALYANGVLQTGGGVHYIANVPYDGWVRFNSPPANGVVLTWSGTYYYKVRFDKDEAEFEQFQADLWQLRRCDLISVRP